MDIDAPRIHDVARQVLEDCAFLSTTLTTEPVIWPAEVMLGTLAFDGPHCGELRLTTTLEVCRLLAESMLGAEPESADVALHARAAVGEVLNIVAGALLARVFGTLVTHNLSLPRVVETAGGDTAPSVPIGRCCMLDDEARPIEISLYLSEAGAP